MDTVLVLQPLRDDRSDHYSSFPRKRESRGGDDPKYSKTIWKQLGYRIYAASSTARLFTVEFDPPPRSQKDSLSEGGAFRIHYSSLPF